MSDTLVLVLSLLWVVLYAGYWMWTLALRRWSRALDEKAEVLDQWEELLKEWEAMLELREKEMGR